MKIEGVESKENLIYYLPSVNDNYLGLPFIKNFNWIIDFENEKLYAKKIKDFNAEKSWEELKSFSKAAAVINGKLMIIHSTDVDYKVGDIINTVNGEKVNKENICRIFKFLMENRNWDELEISFFKTL